MSLCVFLCALTEKTHDILLNSVTNVFQHCSEAKETNI